MNCNRLIGDLRRRPRAAYETTDSTALDPVVVRIRTRRIGGESHTYPRRRIGRHLRFLDTKVIVPHEEVEEETTKAHLCVVSTHPINKRNGSPQIGWVGAFHRREGKSDRNGTTEEVGGDAENLPTSYLLARVPCRRRRPPPQTHRETHLRGTSSVAPPASQ